MKNITLRRCPTCTSIVRHTDELKVALEIDPGIKVTIVEGGKGESRLEVNGQEVTA